MKKLVGLERGWAGLKVQSEPTDPGWERNPLSAFKGVFCPINQFLPWLCVWDDWVFWVQVAGFDGYSDRLVR